MLKDQIEREISELVWPYMDHRAFQGHALSFHTPPFDVLWDPNDVVALRLNENGIPHELPFLGLAGNGGRMSVPLFDARLEELAVPLKTQRLQYPLMKEYTLNHIRDP